VLRRIERAEHRRVRWKNGLGWTTELWVEPSEGEFDWRVSIAEVDTDCEFSRFPGIDRSLLVLDGPGMILHVEGQPSARLLAQGEPLEFSGDVATRCELLGGPTRDFNVMSRRGVIEHDLAFFRLGERWTLEPGHSWLIYVVRGEVAIEGMSIPVGDAVLVRLDDSTRPLELTGHADLVRVRRRALHAPFEP
jgi:environmental stress-induced protein Ves